MTLAGRSAEPGSQTQEVIQPRFSRVLHRTGEVVANAITGLLAGLWAAAWLIVGVVSGFPSWWQAILYSSTATVTFVMVFVIQHTQSKQIAALQRKLDELIRSSRHADNTLISVEEAPDAELKGLAEAYRDHRDEATGDSLP
jgi:low affinity Fe/Cu permease